MMPRVNFRTDAERAVYRIWVGMRDRCRRENHPAYPFYGGRGIVVCEEWGRFECFAEDMGPRPPNATIERKDNDGPYAPGNCVWASVAEQNANRRGIRLVDIQGETLPLRTAWMRFCTCGISYEAFLYRIKRMPVEDALTRRRQSWQLVMA